MAKKPKRNVPKLFGKRIKHKWEVDVKEIWYDGTVVAVYDEDEYDIDCHFGVKYYDFEDVFEVKLLEDYKKDWVVVVRAANKEEIGGKK